VFFFFFLKANHGVYHSGECYVVTTRGESKEGSQIHRGIRRDVIEGKG